eukprot:jgi/Mesvir1/9752/Mv24160-RA.1
MKSVRRLAVTKIRAETVTKWSVLRASALCDLARFSEQLGVLMIPGRMPSAICPPSAMKICAIPRDGMRNCLFGAITHHQRTGNIMGTHQCSRQEVVDYMQHVVVRRPRGTRAPSFFASFNEKEDQVSFLDYLSRMRKDGSWGGNRELAAASLLYCVNINIHREAPPAMTSDANSLLQHRQRTVVQQRRAKRLGIEINNACLYESCPFHACDKVNRCNIARKLKGDWVRNVTEEGLEPNPGPSSPKDAMVLSTFSTTTDKSCMERVRAPVGDVIKRAMKKRAVIDTCGHEELVCRTLNQQQALLFQTTLREKWGNMGRAGGRGCSEPHGDDGPPVVGAPLGWRWKLGVHRGCDNPIQAIPGAELFQDQGGRHDYLECDWPRPMGNEGKEESP